MTPEQEKRIREVLGELIDHAMAPLQEQLNRARIEIANEHTEMDALRAVVDEIVQRIPGGNLTGRSFVMSEDLTTIDARVSDLERRIPHERSRVNARIERIEQAVADNATLCKADAERNPRTVAREDLDAIRARLMILETVNAEQDQRRERLLREYTDHMRKRARAAGKPFASKSIVPIDDGTPARYRDPTTESIERATAERERLRADLAAERHAHQETKERLEATCRDVHENAKRDGKLEADLMYANAQLKKEREQHAVTQKQLDSFTGACADQTIQIMELRGEVMRLKDPDRDGERLRASAIREHARADDLREQLREQEELIKKWDAMIDDVTGPHSEGETYADAAVRVIRELRVSRAASVSAFEATQREIERLRAVVHHQASANSAQIVEATIAHINGLAADVKTANHNLHGVMGVLEAANAQIDALKAHVAPKDGQSVIDAAIEALGAPCTDCKELSDEIDRITDIAHVADSDRIPLAMDLQIARGDIARMKPLVQAVHVWSPIAASDPTSPLTSYDHALHEALREYEAACSAGADDDVCF